MIDPETASAVIDHDALAGNVRALDRHVGEAATMVVVKADAYGHGMVECARTSREAGAEWLGVATPDEAVALREAGDRGPLLAWLYGPRADLVDAVARRVDLGAGQLVHVERLRAAARATGQRAQVHLKIDTGLHRGGALMADWEALCRSAVAAPELDVVGVWTHLASSEVPGDASVTAQLAFFDRALDIARSVGVEPVWRHVANSGGALAWPATHHTLVRIGVAAYGIDPGEGVARRAGLELRPVMTVRAQLAATKTVRPGDGVSYGHRWHAERPTTLGLVPLGYADGIPRRASMRAEVAVGGRRVPQRGTVCMDQFMIDLGPDAPERPGAEVVLWGAGGPSAEEWGTWADTIGYEIVTRLGTRVPRVHRL